MSKQLKIGIAAVSIIVLFIWGFNFLKGQNMFDRNSRYFKVEYNNIAGLSKSSLVTINGLKVGKIDEIEFDKSIENRGQLIVRFSLDNDFQFSKKSVVKIYSPSPLGGSNLAIIPNYEGEMAVSGDTLEGKLESSLFTSLGERLDPIQTKLEHVMVSADSLFKSVNELLDKETKMSLKRSMRNLEFTISDVRKLMKSSRNMIDSSTAELKGTLRNTKKITENFAKVSDTLVQANIGGIMRNAEQALSSVNSLLEGVKTGKGSLGKLMTDDAVYTNLDNATKELEELLRELKLHPKRFVHFSLFGRKAKEYKPEETKEIEE
ncbi:MlaD family protein [Polaribacter sp.]|uniref:MlaD family protein n=1 Tax=Polaribacter sp. TaxID=1920175 RepID=UPI003EF39460